MDARLIPFPADFSRRLLQLIPSKNLTDVIEGLTKPRVTTLRVNTLKNTAEELESALSARGVQLEPVAWIPGAYIVRHPDLRTLTEIPEYQEGRFYVQSLSSMIPALVLDPKPGESVLDISAAPGSKTTQMAALMENTGSIVANDSSRTRVYRLEANLKTQGVTNTSIVQMDGRSLWQKYPERFDKTLVDAPCSLDGRFNALEPETFEEWSMKKVRDLAILERWLLRSAISATKKGGTIVYATCTLAPEENEGVIDWILSKDRHAVVVEDITLPDGTPLKPPVLSWAAQSFSQQLSHAARVYPTTATEGFFVVKLKKIRSSVPANMEPTVIRKMRRRRY